MLIKQYVSDLRKFNEETQPTKRVTEPVKSYGKFSKNNFKSDPIEVGGDDFEMKFTSESIKKLIEEDAELSQSSEVGASNVGSIDIDLPTPPPGFALVELGENIHDETLISQRP